MRLQFPELSLVLLIGPSGCGKSSFARKHFLATEVISSDTCRGLVADDENDQSATGDAFDLVHAIARKRLARSRLTVIDATNVQPESRKPLVEIAREYHVFPVAIVFDLPEKLCHERNAGRPDRQFGPHVVRNQLQQMRRSLRGLDREGFRYVFRLSAPEEVDAATIERQPLWNNRRDEHGPFDVIGACMGASMNCWSCSDSLVIGSSTTMAAFLSSRPPNAKLSLLAIWWIVVRQLLTCCGWQQRWWKPDRPFACPAITT